MAQSAPVKLTNAELATVREAMRELPRLLADLDAGTIDKLVLTQRNQMRAVLVSVERYSALEQSGASSRQWPRLPVPEPPPRQEKGLSNR